MKSIAAGGLSLEGSAELAMATEAADSTGEFLAVHEAEFSPFLYNRAQARLDDLLDTLAAYASLSLVTNGSSQIVQRYNLDFPASNWLLSCLEYVNICHDNPAVAAAARTMLENYELTPLPVATIG